jgi:cytidylate kinase
MSAAAAQPPRVIAIDGPAASGKSTVARRVAAALGALYVDSGAVYRGITLAALRAGVDVRDAAAVEALAGRVDLAFHVEDGAVRFRLDGDLPGAALRTPEVNAAVSPVAAVPAVRRRVVEALRGMRGLGSLVMEGRDIGSAVFPDTPWKFYLDASPEERARRRHGELAGSALEAVAENLRTRDRIDSGRRADPLRIAAGATVIDSTGLGIEQVVARILAAVGGT